MYCMSAIEGEREMGAREAYTRGKDGGRKLWLLPADPKRSPNQHKVCHAMIIIVTVINQSRAVVQKGMLGTWRTQCSGPGREDEGELRWTK